MTILEQIQAARAHHQAGRLAEAEALYRQVLAHVPEHAVALHLLGIVALQRGDTPAAIALIGRAAAFEPQNAAAQSNLAEAYLRAGQWDAAIGCARRAVVLAPGLAEAHINLGAALAISGRGQEAIAAYQQALVQVPDHPRLQNNLGVALQAAGRLDEAVAAFDRALVSGPGPGSAEIHVNLGNALKDLGRGDEAIAAYRSALESKPDDAVALSNLGVALYEAERADEAIAAYRRALELQPDDAGTLTNLGVALQATGRLDEALAAFRGAVAVQPGAARAESNLLHALHAHPDYDAQSILAEHRQWARRHAAPLAAEIRPHPNDRTPNRRLKVGYVSPDFRAHAVGRLLRPLLAHHDRREVEVVCYNDVRVPDPVTTELRSRADLWRDCAGLDDARLAELVRNDRIDILVDLALHTAGNRMLVFARKPAPVQVTMLGLPATTGLDTMDCRLTDPYLDPSGQTDRDYTERSVRLPYCFWVFQPPDDAATYPVAPPPALANGFITFGCLNQFLKVTQPALELWVKVLQAAPGSRLVLQAPAGSHLDRVRALFAEGGIAASRLEFVPRASQREFLHRFDKLDIGLDPFPYNGHTSTLDALWMGVPVVTLAGPTAVGRAGLSILTNIGMPGMVAESYEEYVSLAVRLAGDASRLEQLRPELRRRVLAAPLADAKQYTADVEAAFRGMWREWCGT
jgi:predicted O-linked N-acetylglucosamine transferase (SPINDLY family)